MSFDVPFDYDFLMLWLADLESGKHKQGHSWLRVDDTYCCLGRACDLHDPKGWETNPGEVSLYRCNSHSDEWVNTHNQMLPTPVQKRLGLSTSLGNFHGPGPKSMPWHDRLTALNDSKMSFKEIAAFIRTRPIGLFTPEAEKVLLEKWGPIEDRTDA